jgi:hypothetical protein
MSAKEVVAAVARVGIRLVEQRVDNVRSADAAERAEAKAGTENWSAQISLTQRSERRQCPRAAAQA